MNNDLMYTNTGSGTLKRPKTLTAPRKIYIHKNVNGKEKSFACGINFYKIIWTFVIGSIIGSLYEMALHYIFFGALQRSSGMLFGNFLPIYGVGAVLFVFIARIMGSQSKIKIFAAISLIGGAYEYGCGVMQKLIFGTVSWDYSSIPGSIGGHANIIIALCWGLMGVLYVYYAHPFISEMVERIPNTLKINKKKISFGKPVTIMLAIFMMVNMGFTWLAQMRSYERQQGIEAGNGFIEWIDEAYSDKVMSEKFPNTSFTS